MEYPECPDGLKLAWLETSKNIYLLHCRTYTTDEMNVEIYINRLVYTLYVIPVLFVGLICVSCLYSRSRSQRKEPITGPNQV